MSARVSVAARPSSSPGWAGVLLAMVALVVAMSGAAVALPGTNQVDAGDIRKSAVRSAEVKNESLKGKDVKEASLEQVPSAAQADEAANAAQAANAGTVGGTQVVRINRQLAPNTGPTPILQLGGLTLNASCATGAITNLDASTSKAANIFAYGTNDSGSAGLLDEENFSFAPGDPFDVDDAFNGANASAGQIVYGTADGSSTVTVELALDENGGSACVYLGVATGA